MSDKKKPIELPEANSDEAATPNQPDLSRADELAQTSPLLNELWNAKAHEERNDYN